MSEYPFYEWQHAQGWDSLPLRLVSIEYQEPPQITVVYDGALPENGQRALLDLSAELAERFGVPVTFSGRDVDWSARILAALGGPLAQMCGERAVEVQSTKITLVLPNGVAESLFLKWGGVPRLKREVPQLTSYQVQTRVRELEAPKPDLPVEVPGVFESDAKSRQIIGSPTPRRDAARLDNLPSSGRLEVMGRVVKKDVRESRDGLHHVNWTLTDERGAIRCHYSERRGGALLPSDFWAEGSHVWVEGVLEPDKFTGETVLKVKAGQLVDAPANYDPDPRPRIELHTHSKMSGMDGLIAVKDLFQMAGYLGMPAVALTDHGVVQTYPEVESWSKKTGVKAVYGVEVYMVDKEVDPFSGAVPASWREAPWIVVDVETTGLSPRSHQVIELGAVKMVEGRIVDTFHRMVQPTRSISEATRKITGIRDAELAEGLAEDVMWQEFFEFAGQGLLVAHNARFDMGFMRRGFERLHPDTAWEPGVMDTLGMARGVQPGLKSYGLGPLTDYFKISLTQHHRALADAEATAHLAWRLAELLKEKLPDFQPHDRLEQSTTVGRPVPVVLLVKTPQGLPELYRIISASHLDYFHRTPRVPRQLINEGRAHWLVGSPFHDGEVADALFRNASLAERQRTADFYDYWEVLPPTAAEGWSREEFLDGWDNVQNMMRELVAWGRQAQKPVVAVSDAHYLRDYHKISRDILATTAKGELHDRYDHLYLRTATEMQHELNFLDEEDQEWVIWQAPEYLVSQVSADKPVPEGLYSPKLEEAEQVVSQVPYQRAQELYGSPLPELVQARLEKEIRSIVSNGFSSIYYIAHRLVQKSLDDGYLVGSRGSVGSSLVATFLNITEVNPLPPHYRCPSCRFSEFVQDGSVGSGFDLPPKDCPTCLTPLVSDGQDIPFETFLGFEGDKVPDIDLNFSGEYQPEIHRYTEVLFGRGHVFRAGTIATVADKTAFGLVKAWAREVGRDPSPAEIDWLAQSITGVKRTTGQHPGGLMVVPQDEDIHHFTPVQHPADDKKSDVITTHFDYHSIEGRLLKLDLLGHDDPTAIRMLEDLTGIKAQSVPFQDQATMSLFRDVSALKVKAEDIGSAVGSLGIPEFGTRFVRQMLVDTRPKTFAELIRISGLSHGTEVWTNNAQELIRKNVASLSDVIATRDDIMTYLLSRQIPPKEAFGISEAVRKGKPLKPEQEQLMKEHGVPSWYIESCHRISYLFPKAHAAAYVMMGWRIAWFKVHYPLAYYATYFSVRASDFDAETVVGGINKVNRQLAAIEEKGVEASAKERGLVTVLEIAREMLARGFKFHPIDLQRSHATRFLIDHDGLIIPFAALPGLGVNAALHIIQAREEQPFLSIDDMRQRAKLSKSVVELLRKHGALKELGETSQLGFF